MKNTRKNGYVLCADLDQMSKGMITCLYKDDLTINGDRFSPHFVLARGEADPSAEVLVSLIESKTNISPAEYYYTVLLIDGIGGDSESALFHTNEMTETDLTRLLYEIWDGLGQTEKPAEEISKASEFAYLKSYIQGACFDDEVSVDFLYALWIAFCLHHRLTADKGEYQERLEELWKALEESDGGEVTHWEDYLAFDSDMTRKLF